MILIVADAGPINYLIQIGHIDLLAKLAEKTVLPAPSQPSFSIPQRRRSFAHGRPRRRTGLRFAPRHS